MIEFYKKNKDDINKIFYFILFILIMYIFVKFFLTYFSPVIFGYILCIILNPIAKFFKNKMKFPKGLSSIISISVLILLFVFLGNSIISKVIFEAKSFLDSLPVYADNFSATINNWQDRFNKYFQFIPENMQETINVLIDNIISYIPSLLGSTFKSGSMGVVKNVPKFILTFVLGFISTYFLLSDKENIENFLKRQVPEPLERRLNVIKTGVFSAIGGYFRAQLILMCIIGMICIIGLTILGYPYALFLGIIISFIDALPVFGSGAVFWPWCVYSFATENYKYGVGLIIIYLVILLTRQMLEPRILGNQIGIHPLATLMSIYIGLRIFGVFGFIIGPIFMVSLKAMQEASLLPKWK